MSEQMSADAFRRAWAKSAASEVLGRIIIRPCFCDGLQGGMPGDAKEGLASKKPLVIPGLTRNPVRQSNF
jgi:hypothetical protein